MSRSAFRLDGDLDADALAAAFAGIVVRHEALRTYVLVENDEYFQGIVENPEVVVERSYADSADRSRTGSSPNAPRPASR